MQFFAFASSGLAIAALDASTPTAKHNNKERFINFSKMLMHDSTVFCLTDNGSLPFHNYIASESVDSVAQPLHSFTTS
jgi:hypothetical protein